MSSRHVRCLTNTVGLLHKENFGLLTWWNVLKASAADAGEEGGRDQRPAPLPTSNSKLSSRAACLSPSAFCPDGKKVPGTYCALDLFIYFPNNKGNLLLIRLLLLGDSDGARYASLAAAAADLRPQFSDRPTRKWSLGKEQGGLLLTPTGAPEPLPLFIGTTGEELF